MAHKLPLAEDVNYWKTGDASPDTWIAKCCALIAEVGGKVHQQFYGMQEGVSAFLIEFSIGDDRFRIAWPVLKSTRGDHAAEMRQAATFLYHSIKQKCMDAKVLGVKTAFCESLLLPDGRRVAQLTGPEVQECLPEIMGGPARLTDQR